MFKKQKSLILIHGFLGSGKTTFLNHYMTQILKKDEKVALIVNEFGDFDVDSHLLSRFDVQQSALQGCICCDIQNELIAHLYELTSDAEVDYIIVEATGVANPIDILVACQDPLLAHAFSSIETIGLVDSVRFMKRHENTAQTKALMEDQIRASQTVLINKVDLIEDEAQLQVMIEEIKKLSPKSRIVLTQYGETLKTIEKGANAQNIDVATFHSHTHAHYTSLQYNFDSPVAQEALVQFILRLPDNVLRLKGYIRLREQPEETFLIQYSEGLPSIESVGNLKLPTSIIIIGEQLDKAMLRNQLDMLQFT
ncbi:CobW family GTP-binding protein [Staphylococcus intermedius]|uniref:Cobalamin synthesis protein/P47K family protein n=1 Tax=Staphylococcus intermedius NCTC 11048 TaxID=1141106 RepID=A0A380G8Q2_STAIN|nr:GTP-binding protein [Staphylococcus intermedius]PCF65505.1 GTP-binding protein [Staphylococcus intermedius]PCF81182.1 GTP-binding protein [Staphylococcus intermedius]PCF82465.1 GTP-binding protein [Staphylococcus intermedius]PCF87165.1 GTP-binding protein [Staphylococcus intermedius]PCF87724.1 GTP-binding protein [Staphylococcus intermedius]